MIAIECPRCGEYTTDVRDNGEWFCACGEFGFLDIEHGDDETLPRSEIEANE